MKMYHCILMFINNNNTLINNFYKFLKFGCTFLLIISIIITFIITYIITPIYIVAIINALYTWEEKNESKQCYSSHLYEYGLTTVMTIILSSLITYKISNNFIENIRNNFDFIENISGIIENIINNKKQLICELIPCILFVIWGFFEFYNVNCVNNLNNTLLYKYSFAYFIYSIITSYL